MNSHLNNTFPFIVFPDRSEGDIIEERNYANSNSNSFVINFNKIAECHDTSQDNIESIEQTVTCQESNLNLSSTFHSEKKKTKTFEDFSYSIEQAFGERSLMTIEEEYRVSGNKKNYFSTDDQSQRINPIQEVTFEQGINDLFIHENNSLFNKLNDNNNNNSNSFNVGNELLKSDNIIDDNDMKRLRRVIALVKLSKRSIMYANNNNNNSSKNISPFKIKSNLNNNNNNTKQLLFTVSSSNNNSCHKLKATTGSGAFTEMKHKKGRKKTLLDGIKTEIIDKAFIRKFKKYLKKKRSQFSAEFGKDSSFWKEFFQNNIPPFSFTNSHGEKIEYKSFNRNYFKMIFARPTVRYLYSLFMQDQGKNILKSILAKKSKTMNKQMMLFYKLYGMNMHKMYCDDYSIDDVKM